MLKYTNSTVVLLLMSLLIFHNFRSIMAEANLDALLFELDNEDESEGLDPNRQAAYPGDLLEDVEVEVADHTGDREGEIPPLPPDPGHAAAEPRSPVHRSPIIGKYISSSSARRKALKSTNCNFCNQDHDRGSLSHHLEQNERCKILYFRKLHVKNIDAVLCQLFECLFCQDK